MITKILLMQLLLFPEINPRRGEDQTYPIAPPSSKSHCGKVDKNPLKHDFGR
jgi:hypothetical protein